MYNFNKINDYIMKYLYKDPGGNYMIAINNQFSISKVLTSYGHYIPVINDVLLCDSIPFNNLVEFVNGNYNVSEYTYYNNILKLIESWYESIMLEENYYE